MPKKNLYGEKVEVKEEDKSASLEVQAKHTDWEEKTPSPKPALPKGYVQTSLEEEKREIEGIIKRPLMPHEVDKLKNSKLNIFNEKNDDLTITY